MDKGEEEKKGREGGMERKVCRIRGESPPTQACRDYRVEMYIHTEQAHTGGNKWSRERRV